jgi:putative xylitol transport system permease protein
MTRSGASSAGTSEPLQGGSRRRDAAAFRLLRENGIFIGLILLLLIFTVLSPVFASERNLLNLLRQVSINGILAVGMTFVVLTAGIDLSVGATFALAGLVSATFAVMEPSPLTVALAIGAPLAVGAAVGLGNGLAVARLAVAPFVVTLGAMTIVRGLTFMYTDAQPITDIPEWYTALAEGYLWIMPNPVVVFFAVALVAWLVLTRTRGGRYVYAVGGNVEAARAAGVPVKATLIAVYVVCGITAAIGAIILTGRLHAAQAVAGLGYELNAIAAVVIGGTSLFGGKGGVPGTVAGAMVIGVLLNGLNLLNVSSYVQQVLIGVIIVASVFVDERLRSR